MAETAIPFPASRALRYRQTGAKESSQVSFQIGGNQYSLDFISCISEHRATDAQVVPIDRVEKTRLGRPQRVFRLDEAQHLSTVIDGCRSENPPVN